MTADRSAVSRRGLVVVLAVACISVAHGPVGAYRFYTEGDGRAREGRLIVGSEDAGGWSPDVWGPGETLVFEIAPDPDFEFYFGGPQGVLPVAEQALAAWSDLPSAAISWRVSVGDEVDDAAGAWRKDGRNTIFMNPEGDFFGGDAGHWWKRSSNGWEMTECDVRLLGKGWLLIPEGLDPADWELRRPLFQLDTLPFFVHEFGHCLGLVHSATLSVIGRELWPFGSRRLIHPLDSIMANGYRSWPDEATVLTRDDVVGASLLRPADGWKRTTGSISGVLDLPGEEAARYAHVWALPVDGDPLRDRVGAFTNGDGAFLIEGLRPGNYALWVQPMMSPPGHRRLVIPGNPVLDLEDTVLGRLVRVGAGRTTGGVEIPVQRGRKGRPPPEAVRTPRHSDPGTPISDRWSNACSGVRIQGQQPFAADGPLWFQGGDWSLRGERWFATRLTVEWSPEAGNAVFDWAGPWRGWYWDGAQAKSLWGDDSRLHLDISISDYRIEVSGPVTRHTMEIAWPETTEARLRFRSEDGACEGEPTVVCNLDGCGITR